MALDEEIGRLYGLALEDFTNERNKAARAARDAGRREEAEAISGLRKPSLAVWAINQLARQKRREVDLLLDSGKRLLDSQRSSLEGQGREELDHARKSLDKAVSRLVAAAKALLGGRGSDVTLARVGETLRIAAISAEGRERLARGTLTEEMRGTGWDVLEGLAADLPATARPRKAPAPEKTRRSPPPPPAQLEQKRQAVREAQARRREAARSLREAEREQAGARQALQAADAGVERARRALAQAEDEVVRAERELRDRR